MRCFLPRSSVLPFFPWPTFVLPELRHCHAAKLMGSAHEPCGMSISFVRVRVTKRGGSTKVCQRRPPDTQLLAKANLAILVASLKNINREGSLVGDWDLDMADFQQLQK